MREAGDEPLLDRLQALLRDQHHLLVLDNFEQVVEAAPLVADLLAACSALDRAGHQPDAAAPLRRARDSRAAAGAARRPGDATVSGRLADVRGGAPLRGAGARPSSRTSRSPMRTRAAIAAICRRLDGLPLAIELAAARVKVLAAGGPARPAGAPPAAADRRWRATCRPPADDARRHRLELRPAQPRGAGALPPPGRLRRRLQLERGRGGRERGEQLEIDALDGVSSLVEKSLITQQEGPDGEPRYGCWRPSASSAWRHWRAAGEADATRARHAAWYLAFGAQAASELEGPEQVRWLAALATEHDNFRAALEWLRERGRAEDGLRLGAALSQFWLRRGHLAEGRAQLQALLARPGAEASTLERAEVLSAAAVLAEAQSDFPAAQAAGEEALALWQGLGDQRGAARTLLRLAIIAKTIERETALAAESLALFRAVGDRREMANALADLAGIARDRGDLGHARALLDESLALFRELGDRVAVAWPLTGLGLLAWYEGDDRRARTLLNESLAIFRETADQRGLTWVLNTLGFVARTQGELERSAALHEEALALTRATGDRRQTGHVLASLGDTALDAGHLDGARARYAAALVIARELATAWGIAWCLEGLADRASRRSEMARAVRILSAATALRETHNLPMMPIYHTRRDRTVADARKDLGSAAFAVAWDEGQARGARRCDRRGGDRSSRARHERPARKGDWFRGAGRTHPARARRAAAAGRRALRPGDRGSALHRHPHRADPRRQPLRQARRQCPGRSGRRRGAPRPRLSA